MTDGKRPTLDEAKLEGGDLIRDLAKVAASGIPFVGPLTGMLIDRIGTTSQDRLRMALRMSLSPAGHFYPA